jgi:vacuolar-type H+-ATPase subunit F/Vma7
MEQLSRVGVKEIAVIGDNAMLGTGFALSGIKKRFVVRTEDEAEAAIKTLLDDQSVGIVIIAERIISRMTNRKLLYIIDSSIMPMFVPVPSYNESVHEDVLRNLIIRAIGIDITKK